VIATAWQIIRLNADKANNDTTKVAVAKNNKLAAIPDKKFANLQDFDPG
jgi:hypothetical protein